MDDKQIEQLFLNVGTWKNNGKRAPHKHLLMIFALGQLLNNKVKLIPFKEVKDKLKPLLLRYSNSTHPEYPYVYLKNDGVWQHDADINPNKYSVKDLNGTKAGFTDEIFDYLINNQDFVKKLIQNILDEYFPETMHEDILYDLELDFIYTKKKRNPIFREKILRAYEYKCAVCGFSIHLSHYFVGLEAAHIKWHKAGGSDREDNGLSLCSLHHKLFDYGIFTLWKNNTIVVSASVVGSEESKNTLIKYHGKKINIPENPQHRPNKLSIEWHNDVVFKKPARYLKSIK